MTQSPEPIRILELRSVWGTGGGPEKTILLGTAQTDPSRYAITVCYLKQEGDPNWTMDRRAAEHDIDYVEIEERSSFDRRIWGQLREIILDKRIELIHAHDYKTDFLAWWAAKRLGTIPMSTAHGFAGTSKKERFYYYFDKRILRTFPRVVCVASHIREDLVSAGVERDRIRTVLNAIDPNRFQRDRTQEPDARRTFELPDGSFAIGAIGRLEEEKRFNELIDAIHPLVGEGRPIQLMIAGDGSLLDALQSQIRDLGLAESVRLLGHVDDIRAFHHSLDLFVQSSVREGTPNAVLEAMAFETPIVATDAGGTRDLARPDEEAWIVPIASPDALSAAIRTAMDEPETRTRQVANARARVETDLSFSNRMKQVEDVYDELMAEHRKAGA